MEILDQAKQVLERFAPHAAVGLRSWRYRRELRQIFLDLVARSGRAVQSGPFRGMTYALPGLGAEEIYHYGGVPKLLGCYEAELHGVFEGAALNGYDTILNIGCAEGYYVAGLARILPHARIFALDIDAAARRLCEDTVLSNQVEARVTVLGECTPAVLDRLPSGRTLVLCDCEGAELQVLRPDLTSGLLGCDVLVELHPHVDPSISTEIPARFASTHLPSWMHGQARDPAAFPALHGYSAYRQRLAVSEFREGIGQWAFFASKHPYRNCDSLTSRRI